MHPKRGLIFLSLAAMAAAAYAGQDTLKKVFVGDQTLSSRAKIVDGEMVLPLQDVAVFLGGRIDTTTGEPHIMLPESGQASQRFMGLNSSTAAPELLVWNGPVGETSPGKFSQVVTRIEEGLKDYRTVHEGKGRTIRPVRKGDQLVVVHLSVTNRSEETRLASLPYGREIMLFDDKGLGTPARMFDARQETDRQLWGMEVPNPTIDPPTLAPNGTYEFAAVFSIPEGRAVKSVRMNLPPDQDEKGGKQLTFTKNA